MRKFEVDIFAQQINVFDERWYRIKLNENGKEVVKDFKSVTTYLEAYPKGFGYEKWLQDAKDPMAIRDEAAALGSKVHQNIETILRGNTVTYEDMESWERTLLWTNFYKDFTKKNKVEYDLNDIEKTIYSLEYEYAGTADLIPVVNGENEIWDWKTGSFVGESAEMQVSAYAKAITEMTGKKIARARIIQINPRIQNKAKYKVTVVENIDEQFEDFLHVKKVWERANKNCVPKYKTYPMEIALSFLNEPMVEVV